MDYYFIATGLSVGYQGKPVVESVEIALPKGKILTLIGPNGSGKSTLLKSITKQLQPLGGVVTLGGEGLDQLSPQALSKRAALVLTHRPRPERLTCGDVVGLGRYPYTGMLGILSTEDKEKVDEALRLTGCLALKEREVSQLSDGQLQRVLLARAIAQEPDFLVLDEPTSFLDIRYALELLDILRRLAAERGVTVVMALHELNYAKRVSDLVACVKNGGMSPPDIPERVFQGGVIAPLYDLPPGAYEQLFGGL